MLDNGHLQIRGIKKTDEGVYSCEARVAARGEIDYKKITVVVNGESWRRPRLALPPPPHPCSVSSLSQRPRQAGGGQRHGRPGRCRRAGLRRRRLS